VKRFSVILLCVGCYRIGATEIEVPEEERDAVEEFFGGRIDTSRVRFWEGGALGPQYDYTVGSDIHWMEVQHYETWHVDLRQVLIHEATHVAQNQGVVPYNRDKGKVYQYYLLPEEHITTYGVEQQASMMEDLVRMTTWSLSDGTPTPRCLDCEAIGMDEARSILERRRQELISW